jgi:hypothetical protein
MHCVENHDNPRIMALAPDEISAKAWTAFEIFNQGAYLVYAGQESGAFHTPSLFDIDKVDWASYDLQEWLKKLLFLKKRNVFKSGTQTFLEAEPAIQAVIMDEKKCLYGIFNVRNWNQVIPTQLPDGQYTDLLSEETFLVNKGIVTLQNKSALILEVDPNIAYEPLRFPLLDFIIS